MKRFDLPDWHGVYDAPGSENVRSVIGLSSLVLLVLYVGLNAIVPNNDVNIVLSIVQGTMATMVLFFYLPRALYAIWIASQDKQDYLIVGIVLGWLATDGQAWLTAVARLAGLPPAFMNSEFFAIPKVVYIVAAVMHVIPRGAANGVIPRGNKAFAGMCFAASVALSIVTLAMRPDPRPLIDMMPAWSRDLFQTGALPPSQGPG